MKLTEMQIRATVSAMRAANVPPLVLDTKKLVHLANYASPYGDVFELHDEAYRVETTEGVFLVPADR